MAKRVLILGGSTFQIPLIEYAKAQGDHVITADYLPDNPGHKLSDEYHNVSTTDVDAIVALAKRLKIDAVMTFSSDPALPAVSAVGAALGIPAPRMEAVNRLGDKGQFRRLLNELKLPVPKHFVAADVDRITELIEMNELNFPLILKPVDSCGSKGISVLRDSDGCLLKAIAYALENSRAGRVIFEEYIEGKQIHGDGFLVDGKLVHLMLGDHYFLTETGSRIPTATRWPGTSSENFIDCIAEQVESITRVARYSDGPLNIEARAFPDGRPFLVECAPRNGGNHVPIIQSQLSGFDLVGAYYRIACGMPLPATPIRDAKGIGAGIAFHPRRTGKFLGISFGDAIKEHIFRFDYLKPRGIEISPSRGSGGTVGVALLVFSDLVERDCFLDNLDSHAAILIDEGP